MVNEDHILTKDHDIKERILQEINRRGGNKSELARSMSTADQEISPNYLASVLTNKSKGFSASMLKGFADAGIDLEWLITGENKTLEEWKKRAISAEKEIDALKLDMDRAHALVKSLQDQVKDQIIINYELTRKDQDEKN